MTRPSHALAFLLALGLILNSAQAQAQTAKVETLAAFPHGAFLENLTVAGDGAVTFTSYFDDTLLRLGAAGGPTVFAKLDAHPIAIVATRTGFLITAQGKAFTEGQDFTATDQVLELDSSGAVTKRSPAPEAVFLNGAVALPDGSLLIADSLAGVIWHFDPASGQFAKWLADPMLAPDPAAQGFTLGANGIKIRDGFVYVSNTSRQALYRVAVDDKGQPKGTPSLFAQTGTIDDFTFAADGTIYATSHHDAVLHVAADGKVSTVLPKGCDGCTSLAFRGEGADQRLIMLTTGNWGDPSATAEAKVVAIKLPEVE